MPDLQKQAELAGFSGMARACDVADTSVYMDDTFIAVPMNLPAECDSEQTWITPEAKVLETLCRNSSGQYSRSVQAYYDLFLNGDTAAGSKFFGLFSCEQNETEFWKGHLISRLRRGQQHDWYSGTTDFGIKTHSFAQWSEYCYDQLGGVIHLSGTSSGFYLCIKGSLSDHLSLQPDFPEHNKLIGFDALSKLLVTESRKNAENLYPYHDNVLFDPQRCLDEGLEVETQSMNLFCRKTKSPQTSRGLFERTDQ
ncbi:hypothetical protein [Endozoicomonas sp. OPT23]|uniref:hypothetical protein n=1 Tax=Endozoicomonas sp. OPT23 TaxID=2072845 RepID=UPI00129B692F|nr:hypothetical protein [Endozoicomonas sp. OPT23]